MINKEQPQKGIPEIVRLGIANSIDSACLNCHKSDNDIIISAMRGQVRKQLVDLGKEGEASNVPEGHQFTQTLQERCDGCFAKGRKEHVLEARFTCGIRVGTPE